jgi:integrase
MPQSHVARRTLLKSGAAASPDRADRHDGGRPARAFPGHTDGRVVIPWLDQPTPVPREFGNILAHPLVWEVACFETTLRQLSGMLVRDFPDVVGVADIRREHIEAYKTWLAARPGYRRASTPSNTTLGMRLGHLHAFFARITEWGYDDAPSRIPVYGTDRPRPDKPLPKFLDDAQAAAFMNAARALPNPLERLMVLLLARTGMRRGELLGLTVDAVVRIGTGQGGSRRVLNAAEQVGHGLYDVSFMVPSGPAGVVGARSASTFSAWASRMNGTAHACRTALRAKVT